MVLIIVRNPLTNPELHISGLSFKRRGIIDQVMVAVMKDILLVDIIIKAVGTMKGTNLEWQTLPVVLLVGFIALVEFGWNFVANVMLGVALMPTPLTSVILPYWLELATASLAPILSITIVLPTIIALEIYLLLSIPQL